MTAPAVRLPAAVFGKPRGAGPIPRAYGVLACHPAMRSFEPVLQRIAAGFKWRPANAGNGRCCFGLWPWEGGVVALRFLDAGRDDRGRPHSLRVEACLASGGASGLTCPEAWPSAAAELDDQAVIELRQRPLDAKWAARVDAALTAGHSLLAGNPSDFDNQTFDLVFDTGTGKPAPLPSITAFTEPPVTADPAPSGAPFPSATSARPSSRRASWLARAVVITMIAAVVLGSWIAMSQVRALQSDIARRDAKLDALDRDNAELTRKAEAVAAQLEQARKRLDLANQSVIDRDSALRKWDLAAGKVVTGSPTPDGLAKVLDRLKQKDREKYDATKLKAENDTLYGTLEEINRLIKAARDHGSEAPEPSRE